MSIAMQWFCTQGHTSDDVQAWAKTDLQGSLTEMSFDLTTPEGRVSFIRALQWVSKGMPGYDDREEKKAKKARSKQGTQVSYSVSCWKDFNDL